jgi:ATP-dependent Lon protease
MGEVLTHALVRQPEPIEWTESEQDSAKPAVGEDEAAGAMVAH